MTDSSQPDELVSMRASDRERELQRESKLERERCIDVIRAHMDGVSIDTHRVLMRIINVLKGPPSIQPPQPEVLETRIQEISEYYGPEQVATMFRRVVTKMSAGGSSWTNAN